MASEWRDAKLEETAEPGKHGFVDGPFGSNLPASCYTPAGVPVIRGSNLSLGTTRFCDSEFVFVSSDRQIVFGEAAVVHSTSFSPRRVRSARPALFQQTAVMIAT